MMSAQGIDGGEVRAWLERSLLCLDADTHARLRRLAAAALSTARVDAFRPFMRVTARELLAGLPSGAVDLMGAFADPYPAEVVGRLLGVSHPDVPRYRLCVNELSAAVGSPSRQEVARGEVALAELYRLFETAIRTRRAQPADDVVSALLAGVGGRERPSHRELLDVMVMIAFGGQDATRSQLGFGLHRLLEDVELRHRLGCGALRAAEVIEDLLRTRPAVQMMVRCAVEDLTYRGVRVRAGDFVLVLVDRASKEASAKLAAGHGRLAFGGGPHHCVGAGLARAMLAEALPALARRLSGTTGFTIRWRPAMGIGGPESAVVRLGSVTDKEIGIV